MIRGHCASWILGRGTTTVGAGGWIVGDVGAGGDMGAGGRCGDTLGAVYGARWGAVPGVEGNGSVVSPSSGSSYLIIN